MFVANRVGEVPVTCFVAARHADRFDADTGRESQAAVRTADWPTRRPASGERPRPRRRRRHRLATASLDRMRAKSAAVRSSVDRCAGRRARRSLLRARAGPRRRASPSPAIRAPCGSKASGLCTSGGATNTPEPWRVVTSRCDLSWLTASRTTVRDTPCRCASACSVGSRSPGASAPLSIWPARMVASRSESRLGSSGRLDDCPPRRARRSRRRPGPIHQVIVQVGKPVGRP